MTEEKDVLTVVAEQLGFKADNYYTAKEKMIQKGTKTGTPTLREIM